MINWKLLYDKFGRLNAAKKFEDLALDYVCDVYNEYTWKPTQRTRDGNRDFHIENNCIIQIGTALLVPFHDYMISNYKKLRKGKEYNKKTGDFLVFLLNKTQNDMDTNYLLSLICKCGKTYFNYYNKSIKNLMLKYIHQSEYGTAVYFAEIFYDNISNKKKLTANEKHFLYLYADCLVHCDNQYRAKQFFQEILTKEENTSFEKYEVEVTPKS